MLFPTQNLAAQELTGRNVEQFAIKQLVELLSQPSTLPPAEVSP